MIGNMNKLIFHFPIHLIPEDIRMQYHIRVNF